MSLLDDLRDRFISGGVRDASTSPSIRWSRLGLGVVGSMFLASVTGFSETILSTGAWVSSSIARSSAWASGIATSIGSTGAEGVSIASESWASFATVLGPVAFPVSVALGVGMLVLTVWVVSNVV